MTDHAHGLTHRVRSGRAGAGGRVVDALGSVLDGDLSRREVGDQLRDHERRDAFQAALEIDAVVLLDGRQTAQADADHDPDPFGVAIVDLQTRRRHRHRGRRHRVLDEEIHLLDLFLLDEVFGAEIPHFAGDPRRKILGIEPRDRRHAGTALSERFPVLLDASPERRHEP